MIMINNYKSDDISSRFYIIVSLHVQVQYDNLKYIYVNEIDKNNILVGAELLHSPLNSSTYTFLTLRHWVGVSTNITCVEYKSV